MRQLYSRQSAAAGPVALLLRSQCRSALRTMPGAHEITLHAGLGQQLKSSVTCSQLTGLLAVVLTSTLEPMGPHLKGMTYTSRCCSTRMKSLAERGADLRRSKQTMLVWTCTDSFLTQKRNQSNLGPRPLVVWLPMQPTHLQRPRADNAFLEATTLCLTAAHCGTFTLEHACDLQRGDAQLC